MFFYKSAKKNKPTTNNLLKNQLKDPIAIKNAPSSTNDEDSKVSNISSDLEITGSIVTSGKLRFDGIIKGSIEAESLIVGETGFVDGKLKATDAVILGQVKGSVTGKKVRLAATSKIHGDTYHEVIAIEDGATYEGSIKRITHS